MQKCRTFPLMHPLSTELALRSFEADASFSAALAEFQAKTEPGLNPIEAARYATAHGFSWLARPSGPGLIEVRLRHSGGADAAAEGSSVTELLAGLLGLVPGDEPVAPPALPLQQEAQASEPPQILQKLHKSAEAVEAAAESLAAATGGTVVEEEGPDPATPLTDEQKAAALEMVRAMDAAQRKAFTISFRSCFSVPASAKAVAPLITELKHLHFVDRFSVEAAGGISE